MTVSPGGLDNRLYDCHDELFGQCFRFSERKLLPGERITILLVVTPPYSLAIDSFFRLLFGCQANMRAHFKGVRDVLLVSHVWDLDPLVTRGDKIGALFPRLCPQDLLEW